MTYRDMQIDFFISTFAVDFDGDVIVDVIDGDITIVAFSGTCDCMYRGESVEYLTSGAWFDSLKAKALANPMFIAAVNETVAYEEEARREPDPDYLRDLRDERERLDREWFI